MKHFSTKLLALCLSIFLLSSLGISYAEVYKWRDKQGNLHFGDKPPLEVNAETVDVKINSYDKVEVIDGGEWAKQRNNKNNNRVVMYSTQWCGSCKKAKHYFRKNKIPFQEYDVEKTEKGRRDFAALNGTGIPIILVGSKRMNGFTPSRFEAIYSRPKKKK